MGDISKSKNERKRMNSYIVDTTVLIEHLRGNEKATNFLEKFTPHISTVSIAELIQGSRSNREQSQAIKTCAGLSEVTMDRKISQKAIEFMKHFCLSHGLEFLDALIAATAISSQLILVSDNIKHFRFIPELEVISHQQAFDTIS